MKLYQLLPLLALPLMGQTNTIPIRTELMDSAPYNLLLHGESLNTVLNREFATPHNNWGAIFGLSGDSQDCLGQSLSEFRPTHNGYHCPTGPWFMVQIPTNHQPILCCIGRTASVTSCLLYFFRQDTAAGSWRVAEVTCISPHCSSPFFHDWIVTELWSDKPSYLEHNSHFPAKTLPEE